MLWRLRANHESWIYRYEHEKSRVIARENEQNKSNSFCTTETGSIHTTTKTRALHFDYEHKKSNFYDCEHEKGHTFTTTNICDICKVSRGEEREGKVELPKAGVRREERNRLKGIE